MDINQILDRASKLKIAVIGDLIIDHYIYGVVERISPEAPVPVLVKKDTKTTLGGAGNVLMNLLGLGADAELFCNYIGNPWWDEDLQNRIHCNEYPAAVKTRVVCGNHQLVRIDEEIPWDQLSFFNADQFIWWEYLEKRFSEYDTIVFVDYNKGVCSESLIEAIKQMKFASEKFVSLIVDAKKDFHRYDLVDVIKCNGKEALAGHLVQHHVQHFQVITHGDEGIVYRPRHAMQAGHIPGHKINIVDVCGAGDTVTAALAVMYNGTNIKEACELANIAASEVCKYSGVVPITKEMLYDRIKTRAEASSR